MCRRFAGRRRLSKCGKFLQAEAAAGGAADDDVEADPGLSMLQKMGWSEGQGLTAVEEIFNAKNHTFCYFGDMVLDRDFVTFKLLLLEYFTRPA